MASPLIITGPLSSKVSKEEAEAKLQAHPQFPKNASYALENVEGRWVAAISAPVEKTAAPPDAFLDGGGAGDTPDGPPEPSEAPKGPDLGEDDADSPEDSDSGEDKPKKDKGESEKGELGEIKELLTVLVTALGLAPGADSPAPGLDGPPPPPPGGAPGAPAPGGDNKTHTVHERALKPGEAPPGTTPIGSPSFANVRDDHPWKQLLANDVKDFVLEEVIGDEPMAAVASELQALAAETNRFVLDQLTEGTNGSGQRTARAMIVAR